MPDAVMFRVFTRINCRTGKVVLVVKDAFSFRACRLVIQHPSTQQLLLQPLLALPPAPGRAAKALLTPVSTNRHLSTRPTFLTNPANNMPQLLHPTSDLQ